jgi:uncharacterized protein YbjT (DUF2867 family)
VPVLVHAAHRPVARRLVHRLLAEGGEVRALAASEVASLRAAGAFVASADPDDEGTLEAALTGAHTLVVLLGGLGAADPGRVVAEGHAAARAADGAGIQRFVLVTIAGADEAASDALRRAHAQVAAHVAALPLPSIELRVGLIDTVAARSMLVGAGLPAELRDRAVAPVRVDDLLDLVVAVDDARASARDGHLVLSADGPRRAPLVDYLASQERTTPGLTGRRLLPDAGRRALCDTLTGPWWTEDETVPDAWQLFGLTPTSPLEPAGSPSQEGA